MLLSVLTNNVSVRALITELMMLSGLTNNVSVRALTTDLMIPSVLTNNVSVRAQTTEVRHDAKGAVFRTSFHNRNKGSYAIGFWFR